MASCSYLSLILVLALSISTINVSTARRNLLQGMPAMPTNPQPTMPNLPNPTTAGGGYGGGSATGAGAGAGINGGAGTGSTGGGMTGGTGGGSGGMTGGTGSTGGGMAGGMTGATGGSGGTSGPKSPAVQVPDFSKAIKDWEKLKQDIFMMNFNGDPTQLRQHIPVIMKDCIKLFHDLPKPKLPHFPMPMPSATATP